MASLLSHARPFFIPTIFFCHLSLISLLSLIKGIGLCLSLLLDIILTPLRLMVPSIQVLDNADATAARAKSPVRPQPTNAEGPRAPEWPELASFEGIDQEEVERTEWRNYSVPTELELVDGDVPEELQRIIRESLQQVQGNSVDINYGLVSDDAETGEASASNQRPVSIASTAALSDASSEESRSTPSTSTSSLNIPNKLTNGQPTIKMGPLGWIISYPEGEKPKKSKKSKEPKEDSPLKELMRKKRAEEDSPLKRYLRDKKAEKTGSVLKTAINIRC
jgi:hypothetical protein